MKDLLVSIANKIPDEDLPSENQKHDQLNNENAENVRGSSIKVSISQDSLLTKSPNHQQSQQPTDTKLERGPTLGNITENLSPTEKNSAKGEKKPSREGNRSTEKHRYPSFHFHQELV